MAVVKVALGLIARAENRGLGNVTAEIYRHLAPERTLLVDMGPLAGDFVPHFDRYPGAGVIAFDGHRLDPGRVHRFLDGLDVVYSAETFYDWQVVEQARTMGVASVLHVMPEFFRHHGDHGLPTPTAFWNPTDYLADRMPPECVEVPIPVALDRLAGRAQHGATEGPLRVLHVAGHGAMADRNGTSAMLNALRQIRSGALIHVTITTQDPRLIRVPVSLTGSGITVEVRRGDVDDYADLYDGHHLLVMPRRYAGLSLPVQEAMAAGLGIVMTDTAPNRRWPIYPVGVSPAGFIPCPAGEIPVVNASPRDLAAALTRLAGDRAEVVALQDAAAEWARVNSWEALAPVWRGALADAVATARS